MIVAAAVTGNKTYQVAFVVRRDADTGAAVAQETLEPTILEHLETVFELKWADSNPADSKDSVPAVDVAADKDPDKVAQWANTATGADFAAMSADFGNAALICRLLNLASDTRLPGIRDVLAGCCYWANGDP